MLKITHHNVNDRIIVRERNVLGGLCSDLITGMLHLRFFMRPWTLACARRTQVTQSIGIKRHAYCPVPASGLPNRQLRAAVATARSTG